MMRGGKASSQVVSNATGETPEDIVGGSTVGDRYNTTPKDQFYVLEEIQTMPVATDPSVGSESADRSVSSGVPSDVFRSSPHKRLSHEGARQSDIGVGERGVAPMQEDREGSFNGAGAGAGPGAGAGGAGAVFVHSPWLIGGKKKVLHKRPLVESNEEVSKLEAQMRSPFKARHGMGNMGQ